MGNHDPYSDPSGEITERASRLRKAFFRSLLGENSMTKSKNGAKHRYVPARRKKAGQAAHAGSAGKSEDLLARISIDPNICFGKPCIKGHRIWVSLILDFLANGWSIPDILANYPGLEEADV